jgi:hypothetical protein
MRDYPEPGQITMHVKSLPENKEYPPLANKVRATFIILSMVMTPKVDPVTKVQYTDFFMLNCCDINGLVPKWIVNASSRSVPKVWFKTYEAGCHKYMKLCQLQSK